MRVIVIMAGGTGDRFWPMSRSNQPKQLLTLTGSGQSLLAEAVERSMAVVPAENIYIATSVNLKGAIINADLGIPEENIIAEPSRRDTAGCLIYASATILCHNRDLGPEGITIGVLTADHRIPDTTPFVETVQAAMDEAEHRDSLITIGIQPTRPDPAYGYIEIDPLSKVQNENSKYPLYKAACFHEKPSQVEAAKYIAAGNHYWNSGMFFWRLSTFQNEFGIVNPVLAETLEDLTDALMSNDDARAVSVFNAMPNIAIDYALMEKSGHISVIPGKFLWDDISSWSALDRTFQHDDDDNVTYGEPLSVDSNHNIIYNGPGQKKMAVTLVGVKDMIVVVSEDAVLVVPKNRAEEVRKVVEILRKKNADQV